MRSKAGITIQAFALVLSLTMSICPMLAMGAQDTRGKISGKVTDTNKAVVPGATVKVTNVAMNDTKTIETNSEGFYAVPLLLPGIYRITVEAKGFKRSIRDKVELRTADSLGIDIEIQAGGAEETINVTGDAPLLDDTSGSMGQTIDNRRVAELPFVHGDPYTLMGLAPGVAFARDQRLDRPFEPTHIVGFVMDGVRANRSDLMIDGVPSTATANPSEVIASYVPPTDIIQEFKVQTATFDAQFGNTEGGVTTISIKSGGNKFHGTGYFWGEPGTWAANDFFGNLRGDPRPSTYSNRPGFTATGPVWIPKLYNGRDKTFFTFGFEAIRDSRPRYDSTTPSVPTTAMKNGDFSAFLALNNGSQYQIYNPFTRRPDPAAPGHFIEDPFVGNIIPSTLINPVAKNLLKFFPDPRTAGTSEFLNNNADSTLPEKTLKYNNYTFRVDHILSEKQRIFVRGSLYTRNSFYNDYFHSAATGVSFNFLSRQGVIDDVYTINPTTVLDVKYGYNRFIRFSDQNPLGQAFDLASLGFPASYVSQIDPQMARFPRIDFPGATYQGTGLTNENRPIDTHSVAATLNKIYGTHAFKFGTEFRAYRENDVFLSNNQTGQFVFDNTYTRQKDTASVTNVALSFASFLLGLPSSGGVVRAADYAEQSTTWGFFAQDDWKVNSRLTLNLGLRYELETPETERYNKSVTGFDFGFVQPIQSTVQTKYDALNDPALKALKPTISTLGGLQFAGVNGQSRGLYETPKGHFMPRFGVAYRINDKTVFRGGYGMFYGFLGERRSDVIQTGFSITTNFVPTTNQLDASGHVIFSSSLSNPFPNGILSPTGSAAGPQTNLGNAISFFNQHPHTPYNQRWQVSLQRELPWGFVLEASYVGNRGTQIEINRDINALPNKYLSTDLSRTDAQIANNSFLTGSVANPFSGLIPGVGASTTISRQNLLKPFPQFGSITTTTNQGYNWYHSAQFNLSKRLSKGLTFNAAYTHSKFMQASEYLNAADPLPSRVISDQDYPNRFSMSYIYELPIGNGHKLLGNANGIVNRLVGGWQVQGVYAYQTGAPLTWGNFIFNGDPTKISIPSDQQSIAKWFDTNGFVALRAGSAVQFQPGSTTQPIYVAFTDPCKNTFNAVTCPGTPLANPQGFNRDSTFQLQSNLRTFPLRFSNLRVQPTNNVDFSIMKYTKIKESMSVQFRVEMLNAFNHPWLSAASGASGASGVITNPTNALFGQIGNLSNQANYARRLQIGVKFLF